MAVGSQGKPSLPPIIDIHIHVQNNDGIKPEALELVRRGRRDNDEILKYAESAKEFLKFLDDAESSARESSTMSAPT